jgi:hypothetical protein
MMRQTTIACRVSPLYPRAIAAVSAHAAAEINGVRVTRKGKGVPPADAQEQIWATRGKREVPGRTRAAK